MKKVCIIGGGIIGLSLGYKLSLLKSYKIDILEKEEQVARHQSGNNSGVIHCGLSYKPGSLKAKLAVRGSALLKEFSEENKIEYDLCGKILVATNEIEEKTLGLVAKNGFKNGLNNLKFLTPKELNKREPFVKGSKVLFVPDEGIISYKMVCESFKSIILNCGGNVYCQTEVKKGIIRNNKTIIVSNNFEKEYDLVINCAGLYSDKIFKNMKVNKKVNNKIIPFRGEYYKLKEEYKGLFNHLVYPVPNITSPFLGVHFTRMINGSKEIGPNAVFAFKREGYKLNQVSISETFESISFKGFQKFIFKNFNFSINELKSSLDKEYFLKQAKKLIPDLNAKMIKSKGLTGVRAQSINYNGDLVMDFEIIKFKNQIHVLNAPSPGASSCLSIADHIIKNYIIA